MFRALVERDRSFDGVFYAGITTTGIFCRPGCGAKKPRPENVEYFPSASQALHAGYRPCLRCRPLDGGERPPEHVRIAMELVERHPDQRVRAMDLRAAGLSPERVTRYFKQHYGLTFQAYHRARRVGRAMTMVRSGSPVARAAARAGYDSESGLREAFARLFGAEAGERGTGAVMCRWMKTPLGPMLAAAGDEGVCFLEFIDRRAIEAQVATLRRRMGVPIVPGEHAHLDALARQLDEYFAGTRREFSLKLHAPGTPFQVQVWDELRRIPCGQTRSYLDLARAIKRPTATRAVARANGDNRLAILIPCHRVIGADGSLTGYGGQLWRKQWLLEHEGGERAASLFG